MNETIKNAKVKVALKQIEALQVQKVNVADGWLSRGMAKTERMLADLDAQVVALYGEIDATEDGLAAAPAVAIDTSDEVGVSRREARMMKDLGWTVADLKRHAAKARRRTA